MNVHVNIPIRAVVALVVAIAPCVARAQASAEPVAAASTVRLSASHEEQDPQITLRTEHGETTTCEGACLRETSPGPATVEVRWGHDSPHVYRASIQVPGGRSLVRARRGDRDVGIGVLGLVLGASFAVLGGTLYWFGEQSPRTGTCPTPMGMTMPVCDVTGTTRMITEPLGALSIVASGVFFVVGAIFLGLPGDSITVVDDEHPAALTRRRERSLGFAAAPSFSPTGSLAGATLQLTLRF